jgi:hypothetical protein
VRVKPGYEPEPLRRLRGDLRAKVGACECCGRGAPRAVAAEIGIGYATLNRFMTGNRPVGPDALAAIRAYLGYGEPA